MNKRKIRVLAVTFLAAAFVVSAGFGIQGRLEAARYRQILDTGYRHAFTELTTAAGELDTALEKLCYATSPALFSTLCAQAYSKALAAQSALGELPYGNVELEQTAAFLAKAGDYVMAMARSTSAQQVCGDQERENIQALASTASTLSSLLFQLQDELDSGVWDPEGLDEVQQRLSQATDGAEIPAGSAFQTVEADFPQTPSLIYDGPFSQHLSTRTANMLDGLPEVSSQQAQETAAAFLGLRPEIFQLESDGTGALPTWGFSAMVDGGQLYVEVTKQGGQVLQVLSARPIAKASLTVEEGRQLAADFLAKRGYQDMAPSYSYYQDGGLTVHFASVQDEVYCYPDLVKVRIALDTGAVVGFESQGYLMNHGSRTLAAPKVSTEQAQELVSSSLTVLAHQLALIPTEGEYEVLCHEFKCQAEDGSHVLIYVNAENGRQERILLLLEDENGSLVL